MNLNFFLCVFVAGKNSRTCEQSQISGDGTSTGNRRRTSAGNRRRNSAGNERTFTGNGSERTFTRNERTFAGAGSRSFSSSNVAIDVTSGHAVPFSVASFSNSEHAEAIRLVPNSKLLPERLVPDSELPGRLVPNSELLSGWGVSNSEISADEWPQVDFGRIGLFRLRENSES